VIFSRPEDAWSFLVTGFFGIMALISSLLFLATAINLLYASLKAGKDKNQKIYFKEGATRLGLFTAQISATAIFLSYSRLSGNGFLIASIFMPFFLITSVQFIKKTGIRLPVSVKVGDLGEILRNKFRLTNTEIQICRLLNSGFGKDQVLTELGINHIALNYSNNIYSKTINQDIYFSSQANFKKLPGLLIFLRDISKK
jgi:hypothetical protein